METPQEYIVRTKSALQHIFAVIMPVEPQGTPRDFTGLTIPGQIAWGCPTPLNCLKSFIDFWQRISQHIKYKQACSTGVLAEEEQAGGFECSFGGGEKGHAFHFRYEMT